MSKTPIHKADRILAFDLGLVPYGEALAKQFEHVCALTYLDPNQPSPAYNRVLLVEHPPTITLGRTERGDNLLATNELLNRKGVQRFCIRRGGKVTFHGPGQLVLYPIFALRSLGLTVKGLVQLLEDVMVATCFDFGIKAYSGGSRNEPIGVWLDATDPSSLRKKIGQIGVSIQQGISHHGLAFNVDPDLSYFDLIRPCGLQNIQPTSLAKEIREQDKEPPRMAEVKERLLHHLRHLLDLPIHSER